MTNAPHAPQPAADDAQGLQLTDDLRFALQLADTADSITAGRFAAQDFTVTTKPDLTPVTDADQAVEHALRTAVAAQRPQDSFYGEEFGVSGQAPRQWIVDPIDGTKNFVRGTPVWATLISLYEAGQPVLGVVSAPALGKRWWAASGRGAFSQDAQGVIRRLSVSGVTELADASLSYSSLGYWQTLGLRENFLGLCDAVWRTRAYGDFWSYMLVAEGAVDISAEPDLEIYDMGALVPIVIEAGGCFTNLAGQSVGPFGGNAVATNGLIHEQVLQLLQAPESTGTSGSHAQPTNPATAGSE